VRNKTIGAHFVLALVIVVVSALAYDWIYDPITNDYSFTTITKVSNEYEVPLYFTFFWTTEDELQVGKEIQLEVQITGLPYSENNTATKQISLEIAEKFLNFWDEFSIEPLSTNVMIFKYDLESDYFYSESLNLRFIVPTAINMTFCDKNIPKCINIPNVIHPAPHNLAVQLETNRVGLGISLVLIILSSVIVWSRIAFDSSYRNFDKAQTFS